MKELDEIVEIFDLLGDWDQRYQYLVELGEQMEPMADKDHIEENRVKGCMSQVWVAAYCQTDNEDRIVFTGDCDTAIIKGVLALLIKLSSGKTAEEIQTLELDEVFDKLQLGEHLSPNRHVGVFAIVELMKAKALSAAKQAA
ncbi:MAG: Fe-S metabolism protein SufE [Gammaproteobacteria bacterium SG8_11]|nr:MAG: Fe-S metabolism protein SufE [Gammaproteobacteria bacterium SG8_11]